MEIKVVQGGITEQKVDAVVVNVFEGVATTAGATGAVDGALGGLISQLIGQGEIRGKKSEVTVIHTPGHAYSGFAPERVVVAGLGQVVGFDLDDVRSVSAAVARRLRAIGVKNAATVTHGAGGGGLDPAPSAEAVAEGALLGLYRFDRYKTDKDNDHRRQVESLALIELDQSKISALQSGVDRGLAFSQAAILARDMVNEPPNVMSPTRMAEIAIEIAGGGASLSSRVLERDEIERLGMGAFLGVAQGSSQPPKLIEVSYAGAPDSPDHNLWLIGKGITFDSGGLSLKPTSGMETMKGDMGGGAAVLAAMQAIAALGPAINVTALVLATENMPGGSAQRVGDIVRSMAGKTIEVLNTDAEGRLTLADALTFARDSGARKIVDVATLTGGAVVALGRGNTAAFSNDDELVEALIEAGQSRGEGIWRMPLDATAKKQNESKIADLKNTGGRAGQPITGAHFIGEFAGDTPWVHLDIAGTFMAESTDAWAVAGATGVPTRSLIQLVLDLA